MSCVLAIVAVAAAVAEVVMVVVAVRGGRVLTFAATTHIHVKRTWTS
jgi:hypothetical protein